MLSLPANRRAVRLLSHSKTLRQVLCHTRNTGAYMLCAMILLLLSGCELLGYADIRAKVSVDSLDLPAAQYESVAWLTTNEIALTYRNPDEREGTTRVGLANLQTGQLEDIILPPQREDCFPAASWINDLSRLSNGNMAYTYFCMENPGGLAGELYEWDRESRTTTLLIPYPEFGPGPFSVSPDMTKVLQENPVGAILANELYRFEIGGEGQRILTDFKRAGSPSWAPDGRSFVFAGTQSTPFDSPEDFEDVEGLALSPWNIYEMSADQTELRELLTGVNRVTLKWSPNGDQIAFAGEYRERSGIWLLDKDSGEVSLLWQYSAPFDWSPDGRFMMILSGENNGPFFSSDFTYPTILDLEALTG